MTHFKKCLSVLLALTMVLSAFSACGKQNPPVVTEVTPTETAAAVAAETEAAAEEPASEDHYHVGDKIRDFTITTYDGKEMSLYKILEEKDMVLLNLWGTFCGPCAAEFPTMVEVYEQYKDKIEIIALSISDKDTDEVLAEYVQEMGLTFPVTRDTVGLSDSLHSNSVPVSVIVDRFGTICVINSGSCEVPEIFRNVFDLYTAEDYTESIYMPKLYSVLPDVQNADPAELNAALNGDGGELVFTDSSNPFYWPMTVEQVDGRTVASASNGASDWSQGVVETQVEAKDGDVLVVEYKLLSDNHVSSLRVAVDGRDVKSTSLTKDWSTYAYRFEEAGSHRVSVSLVREYAATESQAGLWIDSIRLVSGEEAEQALAKNPVYPTAESLSMNMRNENMEYFRFVFEGTDSECDCGYVCTDPVAYLAITLPEGLEPENTYLSDDAYRTISLAPYATEDGYLVEIPTDGSAAADISQLVLYSGNDYLDLAYVFSDWESVEAYKADREAYFEYPLTLEVLDGSWEVEMPAGDGVYTVIYVDQNGDPVPGVMCQVCDAESCRVFVSDDSGICQFDLPAGSYEIHTLAVPAGYEGDTTTITEAPAGGGELTFTLTRNG